MKEQYKDTQSFMDDLRKESVKQTILDMGYLTEDDFSGSHACCLFHDENEPSMQVTNYFFKCYGCGAKGDLLTFVQTKESLTFLESIQMLAIHFNSEIKDSNMSSYSKTQKRLRAEWEAYTKNFNEKIKEGTEYAKNIMEMGKKYFPHTVGYDKEIGYLVLPFTSKTDGVLGFTKRIDKDERIKLPYYPKWKHSNLKDTLISNCHNVFNLGMAYKSIKETCSVYVVEGPGDVAAMQRAKFPNTIAVCGAGNFSLKVLDLLYPLKKVFLVMDGDSTGRKALRSSIMVVLSLHYLLIEETYVVPMREGEDPGGMTSDEIRERESEKIKALNWYVDNSDDTEIRDLYSGCKSLIIKPRIVNLVAKSKNFTIEQSREWLGASKDRDFDQKEESDYYKKLLATAGLCNDINVPVLEEVSEEQAKRILQLRFKEKY